MLPLGNRHFSIHKIKNHWFQEQQCLTPNQSDRHTLHDLEIGPSPMSRPRLNEPSTGRSPVRSFSQHGPSYLPWHLMTEEGQVLQDFRSDSGSFSCKIRCKQVLYRTKFSGTPNFISVVQNCAPPRRLNPSWFSDTRLVTKVSPGPVVTVDVPV